MKITSNKLSTITLITITLLTLTACSSNKSKEHFADSKPKTSVSSKVDLKTKDFADSKELVKAIEDKSNKIEGSTVTTTLVSNDGNKFIDQVTPNIRLVSDNDKGLPIQKATKFTIKSYIKADDNYLITVSGSYDDSIDNYGKKIEQSSSSTTTSSSVVQSSSSSVEQTPTSSTTQSVSAELPVQKPYPSDGKNWNYFQIDPNTSQVSFTSPDLLYSAISNDPNADLTGQNVKFTLTGDKNALGFYSVENGNRKIFVSLEGNIKTVPVGKVMLGDIVAVNYDANNGAIADVYLKLESESVSN
jgi:hypothetical protein